MSFQEELMRYGSWQVELKPDTPQHILDLFRVKNADEDGFLGHIVITPKDYEDVDEIDVLAEARYAGPMRSYEFSKDQKVIAGSGMVYWLGEQTDKGPGIDKTAIDLTGQTFINALTNALSGSGIVAGDIKAESGALPAGRYYLNTTRYKVEDICAQYDAEYLVTPQGKLDAGTPAALYPSFNDPKVFIKRKGAKADPVYKSLGLSRADMGAEDRTLTEKLLVRTENEQAVISGQSTQVTSKRTINNTLVSRTSVSGESQEDAGTANSRAAALLAIEGKTRKSSTLSTDTFDIDAGKLRLGERVLVYDPESGHIDPDNEHEFNGEIYWPSKEVVVGLSWPLAIQEDGSKPGVFFRESFDGKIHRITDFVVWEANLRENPDSGVVDVEVASSPRSLVKQSDTPLGNIRAPETNPQDPPPAPDPPTVASDERQFYVTVPMAGLPLSVTKIKIYASETSGFTVDDTTYRTDISVSRANLLLSGQTVKARVPWPAEDVYVRASAVNNQEGPASAEVTTTVPLIPSLAILNLIADKIDAGTISASIKILSPEIYGGILATAETGQRVAMEEGDPDRIKWYSGSAAESAPAQMFVGEVSGTDPRLILSAFSPKTTAGSGMGGGWDLITQTATASAEFRAWVGATDYATSDHRFRINDSGFELSAHNLNETVSANASQTSMAFDSRELLLSDIVARLKFADPATRPSVQLSDVSGQIMYSGASTTPSLRLTFDQAELRLQDSARRYSITGLRHIFVDGSNVTKLEITDADVIIWQELNMKDFAIKAPTQVPLEVNAVTRVLANNGGGTDALDIAVRHPPNGIRQFLLGPSYDDGGTLYRDVRIFA